MLGPDPRRALLEGRGRPLGAPLCPFGRRPPPPPFSLSPLGNGAMTWPPPPPDPAVAAAHTPTVATPRGSGTPPEGVAAQRPRANQFASLDTPFTNGPDRPSEPLPEVGSRPTRLALPLLCFSCFCRSAGTESLSPPFASLQVAKPRVGTLRNAVVRPARSPDPQCSQPPPPPSGRTRRWWPPSSPAGWSSGAPGWAAARSTGKGGQGRGGGGGANLFFPAGNVCIFQHHEVT